MATPTGSDEQQRPTIGDLVRHPQNRWAVKMLILTTVAMFLFPCLTFFIVYNLPWLANEDRGPRSTYAGLAAIVMVQIVVGVWIYISWTEERLEPWNQPEKKDK